MSASAFWSGRRVLVLTSSYPGSAGDPRAWFVHEGAQVLAEAGAEVRVCTPAWGQTAIRERIQDVEVERFEYPGFRRRPLAGQSGIPENLRAHPERAAAIPGFMASFVRSARAARRGFRPETIIGHWLLPTALVVRALGAPAVLLAHGSDVRWLRQLPGHRRFVHPLFHGSAVVPTSHKLAAELSGVGMRLARTVPVGVRLPRDVQTSAVEAGPAEGPVRLGSFGRWVPGKGWSELLDAVEMSPQTQLTVAGMGPLEGLLRQRALEIGPRVRVRGPVVGAEAKRHFFAEHDAFVFAGTRGRREDNLPVSVLEALAHGVPVIATRVGALDEVVDAAVGWLVDPGAPALEACLSTLTRGLCLRRVDAARARASSHSWARVTDALGEVAAFVSAAHGGRHRARAWSRDARFGR